MHFEILVEDQSGKKALEILLPKMIGADHTFRVHPYKGIGHIPANMKAKSDPKRRILLDQLPKLLRGHGQTFASYPLGCPAAVILVCDLDSRCLKEFHAELMKILEACNPQPRTRFCIAIEEGEAWFLGDLSAVKAAYPNAKDEILNVYQNDSICGTWERLADAVYPGGHRKLEAQGWQAVGRQKSEWADKITPHMDVENNRSPSFQYFYSKLRELTEIAT
jgi:hypothetical protein